MSSQYAQTLFTDRLTIAQVDFSSEADLTFIYTLMQSSFSRFSSEKRPYDLDFVRYVLNKIAFNSNVSAPSGPEPVFNIVRLTSPDFHPIGVIFGHVRTTGTALELAIAFGEEYQGKGYGFESVSAVMKELETKGVYEVQAITSRENLACQALLTKCGLVQKGTVTYRTRGEEDAGIESLGFVKPEMKGFDGEDVWSLLEYNE